MKSRVKKRSEMSQTQRMSLTGSGGEQTETLKPKTFPVVLSDNQTSNFPYFSPMYSM